jgi:hypothetical protein
MESPSERLEVARKLGIASVVVDTLLAQRDRAALTRYRQRCGTVTIFYGSGSGFDF